MNNLPPGCTQRHIDEHFGDVHESLSHHHDPDEHDDVQDEPRDRQEGDEK